MPARISATRRGTRATSPIAAAHAPTALEPVIDAIQALQDLPPMTPLGIEHLHLRVRAIAAHLPAVMAQGGWLEWTRGPVSAAIDAASSATRGEEARELEGGDDATPRLDAMYYTGLLVGIAVADSLRGAIAVREELRGRR